MLKRKWKLSLIRNFQLGERSQFSCICWLYETFIGPFGTVWGIMNSFTAIGISQNTSLGVVAPGIAEALFATALGLVAAIPSVLFFNKFNTMLDDISNKLDVFSEEIILIISRKYLGKKFEKEL